MSSPTRRVSRAPLLSTAAEQRALLAIIDDRPELGLALAAVTGKPFEALSKQEKLAALRTFQKSAMALAPVRAGARLIREIIAEGSFVTEDDTDRLVRKLKKSRKKIKRLQAQLRELEQQTPPQQGGIAV